MKTKYFYGVIVTSIKYPRFPLAFKATFWLLRYKVLKCLSILYGISQSFHSQQKNKDNQDYQYILSNILSKYMIDLSSQQKQQVSNKSHQLQFNSDDTPLQLKTVPELRSVFNQWIRSLVMEERFLVLKIYSYPIPQILQKLLNRLGLNSSEHSPQIYDNKQGGIFKGLTSGQIKKSMKEIDKTFLQSLVFLSDGHDYLDHICFEFSFLKNPEKVFDLLILPVHNQSAKLLQEAIKNRKTPQQITEKLADCCTLEQLATEIINFLRQEILLKFRQMVNYPDIITQNLEDEKKRKKQFNAYFKNLTQQGKRKLLLLQTQNIQKLYQWFIFREIKIVFADLLNQFSALSKMNKKEFCNRIFRCKIKRLTNPLIYYHQQIYLFWKSETARNRKRKFSRKIAEQNLDDCTEVYQKIHNNNFKLIKKRFEKSNSVQSNQTNVTQNKKKLKNAKREKEYVREENYQDKNNKKLHHQKSEKKKSNKKKKAKQQKVQELVKNQNNEYQIKQLKLEQKLFARQNAQEKVQQRLLRVNEEIQEFADKISEKANIFYDRRIIAFQRIQFLLSYYSIQIELFGSCACGIAIQNSDIDIAVKSSVLAFFEYLPENLRLVGALQSLQQIFATQPFITDIKVISTASIPIIKFKIDTSIQFLDPSYGQIFQRLDKKHNGGLIQADITIQTLNHLSQSNHLGIISTQAISQWLQQIPSLRFIVIIMKHFLQVKGFNQTYKGGLNTFSMIVMIIAYIYHSKMDKETNIAKVMQGLLTFYGCKFDEKEYGIDLLDQKSSFFFNKKSRNDLKDSREKADLQIIDPKGSLRNMTRKCYLFPYIKIFFEEMLDFCFNDKSEFLYKESNFISQKSSLQSKLDEEALKKCERINIFQAFMRKVITQQQ